MNYKFMILFVMLVGVMHIGQARLNNPLARLMRKGTTVKRPPAPSQAPNPSIPAQAPAPLSKDSSVSHLAELFAAAADGVAWGLGNGLGHSVVRSLFGPTNAAVSTSPGSVTGPDSASSSQSSDITARSAWSDKAEMPDGFEPGSSVEMANGFDGSTLAESLYEAGEKIADLF